MMLTVSLDALSEEISNFTDLPVNSSERTIKTMTFQIMRRVFQDLLVRKSVRGIHYSEKRLAAADGKEYHSAAPINWVYRTDKFF